jgi:hypothetical protein
VSNARGHWPARIRRVVAGGLLLAGTLAAVVTVTADASGSTSSKVRLGLSYMCAFPSGTGSAVTRTPVGVTIAATFPAAATAGRRVQPTGVRLTMHLPAAAVTALRTHGASAVSSTAILSVEVSQRATTTTSWQGQTPATQPLPASGGITVVAPGRAAPVTARSRGTLAFTAAGLTLALRLASAAGKSAAKQSPSPASSGTASASPASPSPSDSGSASPGPAGLRVACTPASGRATTLAAVPVVAASASRNSPARHHKLKIPKGCGQIKVRGNGIAVCGYITGYSDVRKAYGAAPLQPKRPAKPALVNIDFAYRHVFKPGRLIAFSTGELYYQGHHELPPVRATFLAFGFVPVTATLMVTELTPIKIRSVSGITGFPYPITVSATTRVKIRISDVDVNGVPLAIGPHCRPVRSPQLTLTGHGDNTLPPRGYTVPTGGPLSGRLTIPAFTNCGVTENLDPLLTGSISGPGNFVLMTQGKLCGPAHPQGWTCPPPVPRPKH